MPRRAASPEVITIEESDEEKPLKSLPTIPWRAPLNLPLCDDGNSVQASDVCHQRAKKLDVKATAVEDTLEASNGVAPAASPEKSLFLLSSSDDDDDDDSDDIYKGKDRDDDDKNAGDPFPGQTAKEQRKRTVSDVLFATASEVSPLAKKCPASEPDKAKTTTSRTCDTTSRVARQTKDRKRKSGDLAAVDKYEPQGFSAREAIAIPLSGWTDEQFGWLNYAIREVMACHVRISTGLDGKSALGWVD
ncbi:uncharacterized protein PFL1_05079 [Pseudozyma flocculosa PF-1]|uniref:Uncharacterized protein n=1 Tax=Pseudozyma flocculosa PF-1 TaxID=1277687 RepID=A0A061HAE8_9BASI|nr:uncharacterized protein PFL1_05079 [Pseudozyma flocculosa PF-1]EPQ27541.1 hypothetical protein PFL1_05079 [Pseudozyma flocculosa PF-1]